MDQHDPVAKRARVSTRKVTRQSVAVAIAFFALSIFTFVLDLSLPSGYAGALSYVVIIIASVFFNRTWLTSTLAAVGTVGTAAAMLVKNSAPADVPEHLVLFDRASVVALVALAGFGSALVVWRGQRLRQITRDLNRSNRRLTRQDRLVRAANEIGRIGGWSVELDGGAVEWSSEVAIIHGFNPFEPLTWQEVVAKYVPADQERLEQAFIRCATLGESFAEQYRLEAPNGGMTWILSVGEPRRDSHGTIVGVHGAKQDITSWKQAEDDAATVKHRFEQLTRTLPFIVWTAAPNGVADYFNDEFLRYTGWPLEDLLDNKWVVLIHPDDAPRARDTWTQAVMNLSDYDQTYRVRGSDGAYRWYQVRAVPELDDRQQVVRWWGTAIDIHDRVELANRAEQLASERENILESIGDAVYTTDHSWRLTYLNTKAAAVLGDTAANLAGKVVWDAIPDSRGTEFHTRFLRALETGRVERFTEYFEPYRAWFEVSANPSAEGVTVYFRDVTEFRSLADQLHRAQRLELVGRLTGGIAHDFNNLLTVVIGGAESLEMDETGMSPAGKDMLTLISHAAKRGSDLTHHLLAFARRQPLAPHPVDVSDHVERMNPLVQRTLGDGITLNQHLERDLPHAMVDPAQLESALLNLCLNARDAMPEGGTLTLETSTAQLDEDYATAQGDLIPGQYVRVRVADTGTGIKAEYLPNLFDPFFTTKPVGEGTGLGLPMVWGFAKQSGGHVTVTSHMGSGTVFELFLPLAPADVDAPVEPVKAPRTRPVAQGTILVVEDDMLVQQFAAGQLRQHGYRVMVAGSGPAALEMVDDIPHLDLLFTDVIMPGGMTGRQLADAVLALRPRTPVVFSSGYTENVVLQDGENAGSVTLLEKPYSSRQLLDTISASLGTPVGGQS